MATVRQEVITMAENACFISGNNYDRYLVNRKELARQSPVFYQMLRDRSCTHICMSMLDSHLVQDFVNFIKQPSQQPTYRSAKDFLNALRMILTFSLEQYYNEVFLRILPLYVNRNTVVPLIELAYRFQNTSFSEDLFCVGLSIILKEAETIAVSLVPVSAFSFCVDRLKITNPNFALSFIANWIVNHCIATKKKQTFSELIQLVNLGMLSTKKLKDEIREKYSEYFQKIADKVLEDQTHLSFYYQNTVELYERAYFNGWYKTTIFQFPCRSEIVEVFKLNEDVYVLSIDRTDSQKTINLYRRSESCFNRIIQINSLNSDVNLCVLGGTVFISTCLKNVEGKTYLISISVYDILTKTNYKCMQFIFSFPVNSIMASTTHLYLIDFNKQNETYNNIACLKHNSLLATRLHLNELPRTSSKWERITCYANHLLLICYKSDPSKNIKGRLKIFCYNQIQGAWMHPKEVAVPWRSLDFFVPFYDRNVINETKPINYLYANFICDEKLFVYQLHLKELHWIKRILACPEPHLWSEHRVTAFVHQKNL